MLVWKNLKHSLILVNLVGIGLVGYFRARLRKVKRGHAAAAAAGQEESRERKTRGSFELCGTFFLCLIYFNLI